MKVILQSFPLPDFSVLYVGNETMAAVFLTSYVPKQRLKYKKKPIGRDLLCS